MNMWANNSSSRRRRRSGSPQPRQSANIADDGLPILGVSEEGRYITGITDGDAFDPDAQMIDEKGETTYHDMSKSKAIRMCAPDQHNLVADGEPGEDIPGHQAMKCTRCPFGQIIPVK